MAKYIPALLETGVNIVGGCCGTTPAHIKAIKKVVSVNFTNKIIEIIQAITNIRLD